GEDAKWVGREEWPRVVPLEVKPPQPIVPAEGHRTPVERDLRIRIEWPDVRPRLPGIDGRISDGGEVRVRGVAGPGIIRVPRHRGRGGSDRAGGSFRNRSARGLRRSAGRRAGPGTAIVNDIATGITTVVSQGQIGLILDRVD